MKGIKRKIEKLEKRSKYQYRLENGKLVIPSVFISNIPRGRVIDKFEDLEKAKKKVREVERKFNVPDTTWLWFIDYDEFGIEPKPPFYVVIDDIEFWIEKEDGETVCCFW